MTKASKKLAAININFDSLCEAYGFPEGYTDPSYFQIADRFFELGRKFDFRYTIFIIGKDLEHGPHRDAVKRFSEFGHEIGNHSWSHRPNLGALAPEEIREEIVKSHTIITEATGTAPKGFIAPVWAASETMLEMLIDAGYEYDTSTFSSWMMFPALAKILWNHRNDARLKVLWRRADVFSWVWGRRQPYLWTKPGTMKKTIRVLPLPTNKWRIACWHTLAFMMPWARYERLLRSALRDSDAFYYLVHPADLADAKDLDDDKKMNLERIDIPLEVKIEKLSKALAIIRESGRELVSMSELASHAFPNS